MSELENAILQMQDHPNIEIIVKAIKMLLSLGSPIDTLHLIAIFENETTGSCSVFKGDFPRSLTVEQFENTIAELRKRM